MNAPAAAWSAGETVAVALDRGDPVVALESTIITHGLPYPRNLETALAVEDSVRGAGAVPATIAVVDGVIRVGLSGSEIEILARAEGVPKLSRDNLGLAIMGGTSGSTTVAATMICAAMAGIEVFATGGIGGVHRGAADSFDISADLEEFSRSRVTVVSAGAKAILDLPKTLEYLETRGVPVVGFRSETFGAFWSRSSGCSLQLSMDTPEEIAGFAATRRRLGLTGGMLVSNPIPVEYEIPAAEMEQVIVEAVRRAARQGVGGKALTPFLLAEIFAITQGRSAIANTALIRNNAELAARIAIAASALSRGGNAQMGKVGDERGNELGSERRDQRPLPGDRRRVADGRPA